MSKFASVLFWAGILAIPFSWVAWWVAPTIGPQVIEGIADPAIRGALEEAHRQRWGIYVGHWPVTLLVISMILKQRFS